MFEDFGKLNLVNFLALGLVTAVLPKLLPEMRPAAAATVKFVIDLLGESEAEAAEELMQALVSGTIAEINRQIAGAKDAEEGRRSVERSVTNFKQKARQRAHRWASNPDDGRRRYHRHLRELREGVERSKERHSGWQRNIFDDLG